MDVAMRYMLVKGNICALLVLNESFGYSGLKCEPSVFLLLLIAFNYIWKFSYTAELYR